SNHAENKTKNEKMGNSPHRLPVIINAIRVNSIFPRTT
ncbi:hypothetical protein EVA_21213, partial [gut metagenome]